MALPLLLCVREGGRLSHGKWLNLHNISNHVWGSKYLVFVIHFAETSKSVKNIEGSERPSWKHFSHILWHSQIERDLPPPRLVVRSESTFSVHVGSGMTGAFLW